MDEETDQYGRTIFKLPQKTETSVTITKPVSKIPKLEKKSLQAVNRDFKPESQLGKVMTVTKETASLEAYAFFCKTCKCGLKDSQAWYDHINGKKHNQMLGMNMVVERSSLE